MSPHGVPLGGEPNWEVRIVPEAVAEFRDHPHAVRLLEIAIDIHGRNPRKPAKGKAGLMRGHERIRKFRPPGFGDFRVYYAIDEDQPDIIWLLGVYRCSKDHRPKDLKAARLRLMRAHRENQKGRVN